MENLEKEQELIGHFRELLADKSILSPDKWENLAGDLQLLKYSLAQHRLARELAANRKKLEIRHRPDVTSNADADLEWKTTKEYEDYMEAEELFENIKGFKATAHNEAQIRKNNNF